MSLLSLLWYAIFHVYWATLEGASRLSWLLVFPVSLCYRILYNLPGRIRDGEYFGNWSFIIFYSLCPPPLFLFQCLSVLVVYYAMSCFYLHTS